MSAPSRRPEHRCCVIWSAGADGRLARGCAHCLRIIGRHDFAGSAALLVAQVAASVAAHADVCPLPVRPTHGYRPASQRQPARRSHLLAGRS